MKKIFLAVLFFVFVQSVHAQLSKKMAKGTLIWRQDSVLTKEDFKAKHQGSVSYPAYSAVTLFFYAKDKEGSLKFYIEAIFLKSKSYMKEISPYALKHEQLHFDIVELYARKMRQRIAEKDFKKINNIRGEIQKQYDKTWDEIKKEEDKYDKDTEHGLNSAKQEMWNENIEKMLKELTTFTSTEVDIVHK